MTRMKRRTKKGRHRNKRKSRRIQKMRGGFLTGVTYLWDQGVSIFQVPPTTPYGNPTLPVNPYPYIQS